MPRFPNCDNKAELRKWSHFAGTSLFVTKFLLFLRVKLYFDYGTFEKRSFCKGNVISNTYYIWYENVPPLFDWSWDWQNNRQGIDSNQRFTKYLLKAFFAALYHIFIFLFSYFILWSFLVLNFWETARKIVVIFELFASWRITTPWVFIDVARFIDVAKRMFTVPVMIRLTSARTES